MSHTHSEKGVRVHFACLQRDTMHLYASQHPPIDWLEALSLVVLRQNGISKVYSVSELNSISICSILTCKEITGITQYELKNLWPAGIQGHSSNTFIKLQPTLCLCGK